jgi:uncharacterized protein (DUF488 family)
MSKQPPPQEAQWPDGTIFTVGHSTLPIECFLSMLHAYGIKILADIRTVPRSPITRNSMLKFSAARSNRRISTT